MDLFGRKAKRAMRRMRQEMEMSALYADRRLTLARTFDDIFQKRLRQRSDRLFDLQSSGETFSEEMPTPKKLAFIDSLSAQPEDSAVSFKPITGVQIRSD